VQRLGSATLRPSAALDVSGKTELQKMKKLLLFVSLLYTFQANAQNFKKLLTASELDSVQQGLVLYKNVDKNTAKDFGGFEGEVAVRKLKNKISYHFIGTAKKYNNNRELIESMEMDSLG
jgi:hypothetical protein